MEYAPLFSLSIDDSYDLSGGVTVGTNPLFIPFDVGFKPIDIKCFPAQDDIMMQL